MGTFGTYTGNMNIPEEKREEFSERVQKILHYGGMMQFETVSMYGYNINLLVPIEIYPGEILRFHFNYFEDEAWEPARYDADKALFYSNKIGCAEFYDVVVAVYTLYEVYDNERGFVSVDGEIVNTKAYVAWINHLFGTDFSVEERKSEVINQPIESLITSFFLLQSSSTFLFCDTPDEARGKPYYYISDDDRLYWWDGTDEVVISNNMDKWLKELAVQHKKFMEMVSDEVSNQTDFLKDFMKLLAETEKRYCRIFPFKSMYYEFVQNSCKKEYIAAVRLFEKIANDSWDEGKIIEKMRWAWDMTSRKVTHNMGRLKLKRYLSVMANKELRRIYFDF
jgi:hypothetical protein